MTETLYGCTVEKFNKEVSRYLSDTFGEPKADYNSCGDFKGFSYSKADKSSCVEIRVKFDYERGYIDCTKYKLNTRVQISLKTDLDSLIKKNLELILGKKR